MTTPPFTGTPTDGNSLLEIRQSLSPDYSDSEVAEASALTPFSIDSNPETFCVEKPTITPTVDACGSKDQSSVMCNQPEEKMLPVELQEIVEKIIDSAKLVKLKLSTPEKEYIINNEPN